VIRERLTGSAAADTLEFVHVGVHYVAPLGAAFNIRAIRTMLLAVIVNLKC
jgi:hypothetical protein